MQKITLYRKRLIPDECILLKDDVLLDVQDDKIITQWKALKPKHDLDHGFSCYYLNEGFKVSKFLRQDGSLLYWYCDIVDNVWSEDHATLTTTDLLVDVIIYPDGIVQVLDLDELAEALKKEFLSEEMLQKALLRLDALLKIIYKQQFDLLTVDIQHLEL